VPTTRGELTDFLAARLSRPQRHRLLQGYPSLPQMRPAAPRLVPDGPPIDAFTREAVEGIRNTSGALNTARPELGKRTRSSQALLARWQSEAAQAPSSGREARMRAAHERLRPSIEKHVSFASSLLALPDPAVPPFIDVDRERDLIVGVIPHAQCTPRVEGCGFCTFPHEAANKASRANVVSAVGDELRAILKREPHVAGRRVEALYFGGGTANLAAPEQIATLFATIGERLSLDDAEVSLEGVPSLFASWFHAPLKMLASLKVRQRRISMGIQTFERAWIERMGRTGFGDARSIEHLVSRCRSMGITTSGDFLFNLPGQPLGAMIDDVDRAIGIGLDQICLYNLVLYEGLGTPWSKDAALVAAMPDNETACDHFLALRGRLLDAGFVQTTLTNFERAEVANGERAFVYERASFSPEKTDAIGFGPMSLSLFVDEKRRRAVKLLRRKDMRGTPWSGDDLCSLCEGDDLRLLFVTRSLAKGAFETSAYARLCGSRIEDDFPGALAALRSAALIETTADGIALTPRGMFFSDAVVSTFIAEKSPARDGAGVHTQAALAEPTRVIVDYDGMG
jgi:coproporphyrinogen III oxidase-like Fe-S oxidoreductase